MEKHYSGIASQKCPYLPSNGPIGKIQKVTGSWEQARRRPAGWTGSIICPPKCLFIHVGLEERLYLEDCLCFDEIKGKCVFIITAIPWKIKLLKEAIKSGLNLVCTLNM